MTDPREADRIIAATAKRFNVTGASLMGCSKKAIHFVPRAIAMRLCRDAGMSLTEIGRAFGGRDHTTVMNALASKSVGPEMDGVVWDIRFALVAEDGEIRRIREARARILGIAAQA